VLVTILHSKTARVAVAHLDASVFGRGYTVSKSTSTVDTTVLTSTAYESIPERHEGSFSIDMLLDTSGASNGQIDTVSDWQGDDGYPITLAPAGYSTGSFTVMLDGIESDLVLGSSSGSATSANVSGIATGGVDLGVMVEDFTAITEDTEGTARDNGAATANGGVAHLHVSAFAGLDSDAITIEHSVNGSTSWATLVTFATVTGLTSERVVVAPGTAVRQYLRVKDDVTGVGSVTRAVAFSRR